MDCAARNTAPGNCTHCGEGPLLDLRDSLVRTTLRQQDLEAGRKKIQKLMGAAGALGAFIGFPLVLFLGEFVGLAAAVGVGALILFALKAMFPYRPRFPDLVS